MTSAAGSGKDSVRGYRAIAGIGGALTISLGLLFQGCLGAPADDSRFSFNESDDVEVLRFEGVAYNILGASLENPSTELVVYGSGRAVGRHLSRTTEWKLSAEGLMELLEALEATGVLELSTERVQRAHEASVGGRPSEGHGPYAIDGAFTRIVVALDTYRAEAETHAPFRLDIGYENAESYARMLPSVAELQELAAAQRLLNDVLYGRWKSSDDATDAAPPSSTRVPEGRDSFTRSTSPRLKA